MSPSFSHHQRFLLMGASSGMGRAVAHELARQGASLLICARSQDRLSQVEIECLELRAHESQQVQHIAIDFLDPASPERLRLALEGLSLSGVLVNGGGPHGEDPLALSEHELEQGHRLLFSGPVLHLQAALPRVRDGGSIAAITSTTVKEPHPSLTLSGCYRSALTSYLKSLSSALGPRRISVNSIAPGFIETSKLAELKSHEAERLGQSKESIQASWARLAALNRTGTAEEIARLICFLFSDDCQFLTGQMLIVDGGQVRSTL